MVKNPTYTGITPEFWGSCDAICSPSEWRLWGVPNCGKGEPMQTHRVGHGAAPARFRNVRGRGRQVVATHVDRRAAPEEALDLALRLVPRGGGGALSAARRGADPLRRLAHPPERGRARCQPARPRHGRRPHRRGEHEPPRRPGHRARSSARATEICRRSRARTRTPTPLAPAEAGCGESDLGLRGRHRRGRAGAPRRRRARGDRRRRRRTTSIASGAFSTEAAHHRHRQHATASARGTPPPRPSC